MEEATQIGIDYTRQSGIVPEDRLNFTVGIIGVGGIGSPAALALVKMGVPSLYLYDFDKVEEHNIPNQMYRMKDIGEFKVDALRRSLREYNPTCMISSVRDAFDVTSPVDCSVIVIAVDSMKARSEIWQILKDCPTKPQLLIDARMGGQSGLIETCVLSDPMSVMRYEDTLYDDEGAVPLPCTEKAIIFTVFEMAAKISKIVQLFAISKRVPKTVVFSLESWNQFVEKEDDGVE